MLDQLRLFEQQRAVMLEHVLEVLPEEACGLLGGCGNLVASVLPLTNQLHSPVRYFMDSVELLKSFQWLDDHYLDLIAIYHSHPRGPDRPSALDLDESTYPDCAQLIWFPGPNGWDVRGFIIGKKTTREIPLVWESRA